MDRVLVKNIKLKIIRHFVRQRIWGEKHTLHITTGLPKQCAGSKEAREAIKDLVDSRWMLTAIKTRELHYSLNPEKADEIKRYFSE